MNKVEQINPYEDERSKKAQVEDMFDGIAPAYDLMNRAMTFGLDRLWLHALVNAVAGAAPADIVDMATGTGDVALALARAIPSAHITGLDISEGMLAEARRKAAAVPQGKRVDFAAADCTATALPDACCDALTVAYGVRNFADIGAGYREMYRLLRPGGMVAVLELSVPASALLRPFYALYTRTLIPIAGRLVAGDRKAYTYLLDSIKAAPQRADMCRLMEEAGFVDARYRSLVPGACILYSARKPSQ